MANKKTATKKIERLENVCIGTGFLLRKLQAQFGASFSIGMDKQVRQAIHDCRQIERSRLQKDMLKAEAGIAAELETITNNLAKHP